MTMTLRYSHLSQEHKRNAVNLLNDLPASAENDDKTCHKMSQNGHFERIANAN